jgi:hypothetical protein
VTATVTAEPTVSVTAAATAARTASVAVEKPVVVVKSALKPAEGAHVARAPVPPETTPATPAPAKASPEPLGGRILGDDLPAAAATPAPALAAAPPPTPAPSATAPHRVFGMEN